MVRYVGYIISALLVLAVWVGADQGLLKIVAPDGGFVIEGEDDNDGENAVLKVTTGPQTLLMDGNEIDVIGQSAMYLQHNSDKDIMMVTGGGDVAIGHRRPREKLDVDRTVKMTGLVLPTDAEAGKVLISDANGRATWTKPWSINPQGQSDAIRVEGGEYANLQVECGEGKIAFGAGFELNPPIGIRNYNRIGGSSGEGKATVCDFQVPKAEIP